MTMKAKKGTPISMTCPSYKVNTGRLRRKSFKGPEESRKAQERRDRDRMDSEAGDVGGRQQGGPQWVLEVVGVTEDLRAQK